MPLVRFGSSSEYVEFDLPPSLGRKGFADIEVRIQVSAFSGAIRPWIELHDVQRFEAQLKEVYRSLSGSAELVPREEQFTLKVSALPNGHVLVSGTAWSKATFGNRLEFEIALDQTFLSEPLAQLGALCLGCRSDA
jgi:hypothetical protein